MLYIKNILYIIMIIFINTLSHIIFILYSPEYFWIASRNAIGVLDSVAGAIKYILPGQNPNGVITLEIIQINKDRRYIEDK